MIARASKPGLALCLAFASTGFFSAEAQTPERARRGDPDWQHPRTEWGHPDIQGNWTNATLTTFERQRGLGPVYTQAQVEEIEGGQRSQNETGSDPSDPDRAPPPVTGEIGRSYNQIYYDRGDRVARVDGEPLTSLITFPANGRIPELTPEGARRKREYHDFRSQFGEFDHPELRPLAERCIVFYGSSSASVMGPPMTPTRGYNNNFTIVQDADHVLIMSEMVHDVRIIRMGERVPLAEHVRPWMGDSWGHWEGDTLVIETTNLPPKQSNGHFLFPGGSESMVVIERLTRVSQRTINYEFTVIDPGTYTGEWGGEVPMRALDGLIYEYACHEGNYALGNILSGARYQERLEAENQP